MASARHAPDDKQMDVQAMFSTIAPRYDVLNRLLSFGVDRRWRVQAARAALAGGAARVLDVATGTGDLAFTLAGIAPAAEVTGVDFAEPMLQRARAKARAHRGRVRFQVGDGTALGFPDGSFDAVTIGYGLRNFGDIDAGLREFLRVLAPGGRLVVLEFPPPPTGAFGSFYRFYFRRVLPAVGGLVSGRAAAYRYLPASVIAFPPPDALAERMREIGFGDVRYCLQTFGISAIHVGEKPV
ncbi:MAG TPA: bifunctional demethylmenaquinone methyltransferase/2-methoxy-6-polyprenyl-1,4-benzoquinol methylase UbiE [Trueperaceae bacterium]|nr:bifunctional demethylmenaquinone methyltransferase/2-methoxy-6-polyprenyl-1,4-benzoquinol methylase UbiE [Trueperaceae bacterium]